MHLHGHPTAMHLHGRPAGLPFACHHALSFVSQPSHLAAVSAAAVVVAGGLRVKRALAQARR